MGKTYESKDMWQIAFLELHDIRPDENVKVGSVVFGVFTDDEELRTVLRMWTDPDHKVNPQDFANAYRRAKRSLLGGV